MAGTTTAMDLALLLVVLGPGASPSWCWWSQRGPAARPSPAPRSLAEDRAPAALGRLVPVGAQVDAGVRAAACDALEGLPCGSRRP